MLRYSLPYGETKLQGTGVYANAGACFNPHPLWGADATVQFTLWRNEIARDSAGTNYGVYGKTNSPSGYAGYFEGRGYFAQNVGVGVANPSARLQVSTSTGADAVRIDHTGSGRGLQVNTSSDTAIWATTQTGFAGVDGRGQTRGVYGLATSVTATAYGVQGRTESFQGAGVYGFAPTGNANNQFVIRTDKPNVKVSWQVTGVRKDPYAQHHRIPVEEWKLPEHRGKYLHPELYGQPKERGIHYLPDLERPNKVEEPR